MKKCSKYSMRINIIILLICITIFLLYLTKGMSIMESSWSKDSGINKERTIIMTPDIASEFVKLPLRCINKEYPNKLDHVMNNINEVLNPEILHPAFYGCYDWHSSVHGHWMLVYLLKKFPYIAEADDIRYVLDKNLTKKNIEKEVNYLLQENRKSFERTYGWGWFLKLADELHGWDDKNGKVWSDNLKPLTDKIIQNYIDFLPSQNYPIRTGTHQNTAFGLTFALDYSRRTNNKEFEDLIVEKSIEYYYEDHDCPGDWEPGGNDFFSPCLIEADLMQRVLEPKKFAQWFLKFLPDMETGKYDALLEPVNFINRSDPQIVHLDGLNLSRAWCMMNIANSLLGYDPSYKTILINSANIHANEGLKNVTSGDYVGEHWLATFAVYMLSRF